MHNCRTFFPAKVVWSYPGINVTVGKMPQETEGQPFLGRIVLRPFSRGGPFSPFTPACWFFLYNYSLSTSRRAPSCRRSMKLMHPPTHTHTQPPQINDVTSLPQRRSLIQRTALQMISDVISTSYRRSVTSEHGLWGINDVRAVLHTTVTLEHRSARDRWH